MGKRVGPPQTGFCQHITPSSTAIQLYSDCLLCFLNNTGQIITFRFNFFQKCKRIGFL